MKNYVVLGRLWKHAIEFKTESSADRYIDQLHGVECEKCSAEEIAARFAGFKQKQSNFNDNRDDIRSMITVYEYTNKAAA